MLKRGLISLLITCGFAGSTVTAGEPQVIGWRGDGSGAYPQAQPPTQWNPQTNVLWKTKLPSWSNALPVIVGQRVFVCSEPGTLLCLSTQDGSVLWSRDNDILDTLEPAKTDEIRRQRQELAHLPAQIVKLEADLRPLRQKVKDNPEDAESAAQIQKISEEVATLRKQWAPLAPYDPPATHSLTGYTSGTPVSDGTHVWLLLGNGVAACYDLEGNRQWIRFIDASVLGYGHSASPVLAGGRLIVLHKQLTGLDPLTGEVAWQCSSPAKWGTPLPVRVGDTDVVITPGGQAVRASDGKTLATGLPDLKYASPLRHEDVIYFVDESVRAAYRIAPAIVDDKLAFTELWKIPQKTERFYASPVIQDGLLHSLTQRSEYTAWKIDTGEAVLEHKADLGGGTVYPSPVLAGGNLYLSSDTGVVQVVKPGPQWQELARNSLEPSRSTPVFIDNRVYIRGMTHLWCLQTP
jgi:outer membrane protein assembly factor BamB